MGGEGSSVCVECRPRPCKEEATPPRTIFAFPTAQVDGGFEKYFPGELFEVESLRAIRASKRHVQYLVNWKGYDQTHNSWEPEHVIPQQCIEDFHDARDITIDTAQTEADIAFGVGSALLKVRLTSGEFKVVIPTAAYSSVAHSHSLLARARSPPSRAGQEPLELELDVGEVRQTTAVQFDSFEDAGWFIQGELAYPDRIFGCAMLKKGRGSAHDMYIIGGPLCVQYVPPAHAQPPSHTQPTLSALQVHGANPP